MKNFYLSVYHFNQMFLFRSKLRTDQTFFTSWWFCWPKREREQSWRQTKSFSSLFSHSLLLSLSLSPFILQLLCKLSCQNTTTYNVTQNVQPDNCTSFSVNQQFCRACCLKMSSFSPNMLSELLPQESSMHRFIINTGVSKKYVLENSFLPSKHLTAIGSWKVDC